MKKLILLSMVICFVSCSKNKEILYKYAYIDSRKTNIVTTHLINENHILNNEEISERLNIYRIKKDEKVLKDTILRLEINTGFLIEKANNNNYK